MSNPEDSIITHHSEMELIILNKFRHRIEKQHILNNFSSKYFSKLNNYLIIPTIAITSISSVASFLTTSTVIPDGSKQYLALCIGILTAIASIFQTLDSSLGYSVKKKAFSNAATKYNDLITKIEFEICNPNEKFTEFCNYIEESILQIKNDCKYTPPTIAFDYYNKNKKKIIKDNDSLDSLVYSNQQYSQTNINKMIGNLKRTSEANINVNNNKNVMNKVNNNNVNNNDKQLNYNTFDYNINNTIANNTNANNNINNTYEHNRFDNINNNSHIIKHNNLREKYNSNNENKENNDNVEIQLYNYASSNSNRVLNNSLNSDPNYNKLDTSNQISQLNTQITNNNNNNNNNKCNNKNNNVSINITGHLNDQIKEHNINKINDLEYDDEFAITNKKNNNNNNNNNNNSNELSSLLEPNNILTPIKTESHVINFATEDVSDI
jgi:hypothetical protein